MAQNATAEAPESSEVGVAQLPVPERQYAGGGIIAFAEGDLVNEEEDEMAEYQNALSKAVANRSYLSTLKDSLKKAIPFSLPQSYQSALAERKTPEAAKPVERSRGGHKYEDVVVKEAERLGIDPNLALHVLYKETGNLKNPETAKSPAGAIGVMQLMPKTAKGLGVNPLNPEENIRGGVTYLKQMYDKYQDPTLALAAYNAGPGRVDKALKSGQGIAALPRETQNYIRMAGGGEVKHFVNGGTSYDPLGMPIPSPIVEEEPLMSREYQKYYNEYKKELEKIASDLLEQNANAVGDENKPNYSNRDFMNALIIFQTALMDKMYDNQSFDQMPVEHRLAMANSCGTELRKLIHTYTGLDTQDVEKFV